MVLAVYIPTAMAQSSAATGGDLKLAQHFGETFELTDQSGSKIKVLSYGSPRELRVCNLTGRGGYFQDESGFVPLWERAMNSSGTQGAVLTVSDGSRRDRLRPGQCDQLRASHVALSLDPRLGVEDVFVGSVVASGMTPEDATTRSYKDLAAQLSHDDEVMRQTALEFEHARSDLQQTAEALRAAGRKESAVQQQEEKIGEAESAASAAAPVS
jgi:hypothetical protein